MKNKTIGKIISVSDLNIKVLLDDKVEMKDILYYVDDNKNMHRFEVAEMHENIALAIPFESVHGLKKGINLYRANRRITNRIFRSNIRKNI